MKKFTELIFLLFISRSALQLWIQNNFSANSIYFFLPTFNFHVISKNVEDHATANIKRRFVSQCATIGGVVKTSSLFKD